MPCEHDWREFNAAEIDSELSVGWQLETDSQWITMAGVRQCALCYRLSFDLDYVPHEHFILTLFSLGTAPTSTPEP